MKAVHIVAVGKELPMHYRQLFEAYQQKASRWFSVKQLLIEPSKIKNKQAAKQDEANQILQTIPNNSFIVLLDERGAQFDSLSLSKSFAKWLGGKPLYIIIGGAYGVTQDVRDRSDAVWSFSGQVFPHQLMRVMLMEQLYRSAAIKANLPYHHS